MEQWQIHEETSIPSSAVSLMLRVEYIAATLSETARAHEHRMERMEKQIDGLITRPPTAIDWSTVIKLSTALLLMGMAGLGVITWPEAQSYSATMHGTQ